MPVTHLSARDKNPPNNPTLNEKELNFLLFQFLNTALEKKKRARKIKPLTVLLLKNTE